MTFIDFIVRRYRPHWVRHGLKSLRSRYETFAPLPILELPSGTRVCVVAPHPDDESIGCGGLLAGCLAVGGIAEVVFLTRGELGSVPSRDSAATPADRQAARARTAQVRYAEAGLALSDLGATGVWLDGRDGALHQDEDRLVRALAEHWTREPPDLIAAPCPLDRHADHAVAARIAAAAAQLALPGRRVPVWGYEVWSPVPATGILDITPVAAKKWLAISRHRSQLATTDYIAAARGMATYRAITAGLGSGRLAEAFLVMDVAGYARLADELRV